jgi:hypothetical protein
MHSLNYIHAVLSENFSSGLVWFVTFVAVLVMEHHKEIIKNRCHKIPERINSMSLVNLDDQQVHSLVMMREIARGVVDDRDRKVRL